MELRLPSEMISLIVVPLFFPRIFSFHLYGPYLGYAGANCLFHFITLDIHKGLSILVA